MVAMAGASTAVSYHDDLTIIFSAYYNDIYNNYYEFSIFLQVEEDIGHQGAPTDHYNCCILCNCDVSIQWNYKIIVEFHPHEVACLVSPQKRDTFSQCLGTLALPLSVPPQAGRGG